MAMLTGQVDCVVGVDPHKYEHVAAVVDHLGGLVAQTATATSGTGNRNLLEWAMRTAPERRVWAIEGTGSYGAPLTRMLVELGEQVYEVDHPKRPIRRNGAKSDPIDALRAAREVLAADKLGQPRVGADRELVRSLLAARELATNSRRTYLCSLKGELIHLPDGLRERLLGLTTTRLLDTCRRLRLRAGQSAEVRQQVAQLRRLAGRVREFEADAAADEAKLTQLMRRHAPGLLEVKGIGSVTAAAFFNGWCHAGRLRGEAAFAMLCGAAPIPASSGQQARYRLNRGGDRRLNRALHQVTLCRITHDAETRQYAARRRSEGKTSKEVQRCLKRFLARRVFRILSQAASTP